MPEIFATEFKNESNQDYIIFENGRRFATVPAQRRVTIESESALTTYARFAEVLITERGVVVRERSEWQSPLPPGAHVLEMINVDGQPLEQRVVGEQAVSLPRGIPVQVACPLDDPLIFFERVEIRRTSERVRDELNPGYLIRQRVLRDVKTSRPESEVQRLIALITAQDLEMPPREAMPAEEAAPFTCEVENKSDAIVSLHTERGRMLLQLEPKGKVILEMNSALALYARFKHVIFQENGKIEVAENGQWRLPWNGRTILLHNIDGHMIESVTLNGKTVYAPKGLPIVAEAAITDADVFHKAISWKKVLTKRPMEGFPGYTETVEELKMIKTPRDKKELEHIRQERLALGIKAQEETLARHMKKFVAEQ